MPTYQYACTACGTQLEAVQAFTDAPLTECAACGGRLRKVFGAVGVVFKGSGFYKTDSRSAGKPAQEKDGGGDSAPTGPAKKEVAPAAAGSSPSGSSSTTSSPSPASSSSATTSSPAA